jgi:hypothetical protein
MRAGDEVVAVNGIDVNGDPDRLVSLIAPQNSPKALLQIKVSLSCTGSFVGCVAFEAHYGGRELGGGALLVRCEIQHHLNCSFGYIVTRAGPQPGARRLCRR